MNDLRTRTAALLADVETELRHTGAADDQIGAHAADAHDTLTVEIAKQARRLEPEGNDPDAEAARPSLRVSLCQQAKAALYGRCSSSMEM